jgi:hypothetical protein
MKTLLSFARAADVFVIAFLARTAGYGLTDVALIILSVWALKGLSICIRRREELMALQGLNATCDRLGWFL